MHTHEANPVKDLVKNIIATVTEEELSWPDDAVYKVTYRLRAWPCGYSEPIIKFFSSLEALKKWESDKAQWARLEDNSVTYSVEQWDLGPVYKYSKDL